MPGLNLPAIDYASFLIGGLVFEGGRMGVQVLYKMVIRDIYRSWREAQQSEEDWYADVDEALMLLNRGIIDYRCDLIFKEPERLEEKLDAIAETLRVELRDPPDRIDESLRQDLVKVAEMANTLAGVATNEDELEKGMKDFVGSTDYEGYQERVDGMARELGEKTIEVRRELRTTFDQ